MSLFMPTWHPVREADMPKINLPPDLAAELPPEMVELEHRTQVIALQIGYLFVVRNIDLYLLCYVLMFIYIMIHGQVHIV